MLNLYNECFTFLEPYSAYIRHLYERRCKPLGQLDVTVVHLRAGDLDEHYEASAPNFINFVRDVCLQRLRDTEVVIVAEDYKHKHVHALESALLATGELDVRIKKTGKTTVQDDFDMLYRAKNIIMANSTFSWWGAWLNPFKPNVFVGLSTTQPHHHFRTPWMFLNGPTEWHLYDMDIGKWIQD